MVATRENTVAEADETFTVRLTEADAGARLRRATATGTIEDDDVLTVNIVGPETVVEGVEGSSARYTATLTGGTGSAEVEVYYTVEGTATKGDDYDPPDGTLTFDILGAGATTQSFTITPKDDTPLEDDGETLVGVTDECDHHGNGESGIGAPGEHQDQGRGNDRQCDGGHGDRDRGYR